jgi:signal transduction histidine kinase
MKYVGYRIEEQLSKILTNLYFPLFVIVLFVLSSALYVAGKISHEISANETFNSKQQVNLEIYDLRHSYDHMVHQWATWVAMYNNIIDNYNPNFVLGNMNTWFGSIYGSDYMIVMSSDGNKVFYGEYKDSGDKKLDYKKIFPNINSINTMIKKTISSNLGKSIAYTDFMWINGILHLVYVAAIDKHEAYYTEDDYKKYTNEELRAMADARPVIVVSFPITQSIVNSIKHKTQLSNLSLYKPGQSYPENMLTYDLLDNSTQVIGVFAWNKGNLVKDFAMQILSWFVLIILIFIINFYYFFKKATKARKEFIMRDRVVATRALVAGIVHKISKPLGASVLGISIMENDFSKITKKSEDLSKQMLIEIHNNLCNALLSVVPNIKKIEVLITKFKELDFVNATPESFNFKNYIVDITQIYSLKYQVKIKIDCVDTLQVTANKELFNRVLDNLLSNTVVHAFNSKSKDPEIKIEVAPTDYGLEIIIADNGKGFSAEMLEDIFTPLHTGRFDSEVTGFGLHIVFHIITQQLNGTITVESEVGKGTKFFIKVPKNSSTCDYTQ